MVPRIHKRGTSFKGACTYILHDAQQESADRVLWSQTVNLGDAATDTAWERMFETWRDRTRLKREAGVDLRGRDNTNPVLHVTLSWAHDEKPTPEHMRETALSALKALKLDEHQAVMAAHSDKEHLHVHLVINTVHPETGRTAPMKYTKEAMSRWAEAYEREHGIHCEQRIRNNEERDRIRAEKNAPEKREKKSKAKCPKKSKQKAPSRNGPDKPNFDPVKDRTPARPYAIEQKAIVDRMRRLRTEIDHKHLVERDVTSSRQRAERDDLFKTSRAATRVATEHVADRFRSRWRELFSEQRTESARIAGMQGNIFERACFVFSNLQRLGAHKPLTWKDKLRLILSPRKLAEAVERIHTRERRLLSAIQKLETKERLDRIWENHQYKTDALVARQAAERVAQKDFQQSVTENLALFKIARDQLCDERAGQEPVRRAPGAPEQETDAQYVERVRDDMDRYYERRYPNSAFREEPALEPERTETPVAREPAEEQPLHVTFNQVQAPETPALSRAEQIKRNMEQYRARNPGRDHGNEM